ncbi:MAG: bifunctional methylenetetrahydrofolate dehydrogenase/methenyltetrahydrofolate cyclohydrolase [Candidatus Altiarchaeales archaeon]|nr:bifunctional methylenetetrahydrofolate dehydrogenase/methenyltetrahydrofolate cyclohydrolase [Candidatus Altiarchaeales archaeon]
MASRLIEGSKLASEIKEGVKRKSSRLSFKPGLATVIVGSNPASKMYVSMKQKACVEAGFYFENFELPKNVSEGDLISLIGKLNVNGRIHGILLQLPLPKHINNEKVMESISPGKDVDGFHPLNMGRLMAGDESFAAATPKGIIRMLEEYKVKLEGKNVVVVNHSTVVGKPLALMLLNRNATVSVCHKYTKNLKEYTLKADVLITAVGVPKLVKSDMVKPGVVVVDAGISKSGDKTVGDVDFEGVSKKASLITPVPGGVGPMTIASLLENTLMAAERNKS